MSYTFGGMHEPQRRFPTPDQARAERKIPPGCRCDPTQPSLVLIPEVKVWGHVRNADCPVHGEGGGRHSAGAGV